MGVTLDDVRHTLERYGAVVDPHGDGLNVTCPLHVVSGLADYAQLVPPGFAVRYTPDGFIVETAEPA